MAKEASNSSNISYYKINGKGYLYQKASKDEALEGDALKKGYDSYTNDKGDTFYQKVYVSTDDGKLNFIGIVEKNYPTGKVKELSISVEGSSGIDCISIPLYSQGRLNSYVKNIATILPNVDFSKEVCLYPSKKMQKSTNGKSYLDRSIFFTLPGEPDGENFVRFAHKYGKDGDIPSTEMTENSMGEQVRDFSAQDAFLGKVLKEQIERFKTFKDANKNETPKVEISSNKEEKIYVAEVITEMVNNVSDDLPF